MKKRIINGFNPDAPKRTISEILDEKFRNVRKTPGIQIWRIKDFEMEEIANNEYSIFFGGDSYILLKTIERKSQAIERRIHFWLGEKSTIDERGAAAIWATHLDDWFGGQPIQFRETQHAESGGFMGYFPNGITYKKGGVASAFNKVKTNALDNRSLFQVKGKRRPRLIEVECSWDSFNEGDVFILDYHNWLIQWNGKEANRFEKLKACQCLQEIYARHGRQERIIIEQGRFNQVLQDCLGGMPAVFNPASDDAEFEKKKELLPAIIYKAFNPVPLAGGRDIHQNLLLENEIYIVLDNEKVFAWKGRKSTREQRKDLSMKFDDFLDEINFKGNSSVEMLNQGSESATFKQVFDDWVAHDKADLFPTIEPQNQRAETIAGIEHLDLDEKMRSNVRKVEGRYNPDDGRSGEITVWRIETGDRESDLREIDREDYGKFYGGDCYIVKYVNPHTSPKMNCLYYWIGMNSTIDEQTAVAHHVTKLDRMSGGSSQHVRVVQGKEPPHMQQIFASLVIYRGGTGRKNCQSKRNNPSLFQVRGSLYGYSRTVETTCSASNLNSNDAFVLFKDEHVWVWLGKAASGRERIGAEEAVDAISKGGSASPVFVNEGDEDDRFWSAIGGRKEYAKILDVEAIENAKLFVCSNATGKMTVEEIGEDFTQDDLISDDVMILDGGNDIFVWIGRGSNKDEQKHGPEIARQYAAGCSARKKIRLVEEGAEPVEFTGFFHAWLVGYDPRVKFETMQLTI